MEDSHVEGDNNKDVEVAPALIGVHPTQKYIVVAVGSDLRVFDIQTDSTVCLVDKSGGSAHKDSIRSICFDKEGKLFASAGDDKLVKIWATDSDWRCISTVSSEKRVTAVAISNDGMFVCFSDKFGVVWVVDLNVGKENEPLVEKKAVPLLAHYCSIITSLKFSPHGRFIISADRDFKIRVTVFPKKPLDGAHEIQSFCLGHSEFVSCLAFVGTPDFSEAYLISGSGDSTVKMWDIASGSLLHSCEVGSEILSEPNDKEQEGSLAVTDICVIPDGTLVAVAIQGLQGVLLLSCDLNARTLSVVKVIPITGQMFIPTSLSTSSCTNLLWIVTGVSNLDNGKTPSLTRVRAISNLSKTDSESTNHEPLVLEDEQIPGGEKLLEKLQGSVLIDNAVFLAAAEAVKTAMCNLLIKKQYGLENREFRKRTRNDKRSKRIE